MSIEKQINDEFLSVALTPGNLLIYAPRTSILESVKRETALFYGNVLDLGCGFMPYRSIVEANPSVDKYTGMDLESPTYYGHIEPDLKWDGTTIPLDDESVDCLMATEFFEHYSEPEKILAEIKRVLKPGGRFFGTVPFIWNLHEIPFDEYRYTPFSLKRIFEGGGFEQINISALGGWNLAFAQMIGLWVTFVPINRHLRTVLRYLLFPVFVILVKTDRRSEGFDPAGRSMYNGLSIIAIKSS